MTRNIIHLALAAVTIGILGTSCDSQPKKTTDLQTITDSMEHPHNYADTLNADRQDWEKFKIASQNRIRQNQDTIDALKRRISVSNKKMKATYEDKIAHVEAYNQQLKKRIDQYQEEGRGNWTRFKQNFNNDMDTLSLRINTVFADDSK